MKDNLTISFIVPFYNVEKYIAACLDSLYAQDISEDEYEVILIDDCSHDGSRDIVEGYMNKYHNILLLTHIENKCLGGARNTGLRAARGEYVWFIDSDDMVKCNCLSDLLQYTKDQFPDILLFNFEKITDTGEVLESVMTFPKSTTVLTGINYVNQFFGDEFVYHLGYVWRLLYRREYLLNANIYFPEHVFWEDTVFMPKSILMAKKVFSLKAAYYQYRVNPTSVSGIYNKQYRADLIFQLAFNAGIDLMAFSKDIKQKDKSISEMLYKKSIWYLNSFVPKLLNAPIEQRKVFFRLIAENENIINSIYSFTNGINRLFVLYPKIGFCITLILSPLYRFKLYIKNAK